MLPVRFGEAEPVAVAEAERRLARLDLDRTETLVVEFIRAFRPDFLDQIEEPSPDAPPGSLDRRPWQEKQLIVRGDEWVSRSREFEHIVSRGVHLLVDIPNRNIISVYHPGQCRVFTERLDWFLDAPQEKLAEMVREEIEREDGLVELRFSDRPRSGDGGGDVSGNEGPLSWVRVDPNDGLPRAKEIRNRATGDVAWTGLYHGQTVFPGEVMIPVVKIEMGYREGILQTAKLTLVSDAEFNLNVEDQEFVHATATGTTWFDYRSGEKIPGVMRSEVPDAVEYFVARGQFLPGAGEIPEEDVDAGGFDWRATLLIINGIFLISLGIYVYRRSL